MNTKSHLSSTDDLTMSEIVSILDRAEVYFQVNKLSNSHLHQLSNCPIPSPTMPSHSMRGLTHVNLFFEPSTRTQNSFALAAMRLGAYVLNFFPKYSSIQKGETHSDTLRTILAMQPHSVAIRSPVSLSSLTQELSKNSYFSSLLNDIFIINAGDAGHEHPTQAITDLFVIKKHKKNKFQNLRVVICGDIMHSRVAHSDIKLFQRFGMNVCIAGPQNLLPPKESLPPGVDIHHGLKEGIRDADVVITFRLQKERMNDNCISKNEYEHMVNMYKKEWCLSKALLTKYAKRDVLIMHPGPANRNVEIVSDLIDDSELCCIFAQVEAGVSVRMAILDYFFNVKAKKKVKTIETDVHIRT